MREQYEQNHYRTDLEETGKVIHEFFPEYSRDFMSVMQAHRLCLCNLFVARRELFRSYCAFLFPVLFELERRLDPSGYEASQSRLYGFLAERIFNVWLEHQGVRKLEVPVVRLEKLDKFESAIYTLKSKWSDRM